MHYIGLLALLPVVSTVAALKLKVMYLDIGKSEFPSNKEFKTVNWKAGLCSGVKRGPFTVGSDMTCATRFPAVLDGSKEGGAVLRWAGDTSVKVYMREFCRRKKSSQGNAPSDTGTCFPHHHRNGFYRRKNFECSGGNYMSSRNSSHGMIPPYEVWAGNLKTSKNRLKRKILSKGWEINENRLMFQGFHFWACPIEGRPGAKKIFAGPMLADALINCYSINIEVSGSDSSTQPQVQPPVQAENAAPGQPQFLIEPPRPGQAPTQAENAAPGQPQFLIAPPRPRPGQPQY